MSKGKVKARGYIVSAVKKEGYTLYLSESDEFDVIDFNAGATLQDDFGHAFDNAHLSDPVVAQTVLHLTRSRGEMTVLLPAGLASEKFLAAYYEKKTFRWVSIVVWKTGGRGIVFTKPSVLWGQARLFDVSVTRFFLGPKLPGYAYRLDDYTLKGTMTDEELPALDD